MCNLQGETRRDQDCEIIDTTQSTYLDECKELGVKCGIIVTYGLCNFLLLLIFKFLTLTYLSVLKNEHLIVYLITM